ncbi:hypothetical protein EVAR_98723_1 [Eumeta japonica]|uniref:Uncharacterized protein n=1 Tax=Eumeta variegata TaxID=151549 RepID=A0A4C1ZJZ4_EUMVA|nr:hypothetical protein EVAR_98723_1 [Eumeta japonica]
MNIRDELIVQWSRKSSNKGKQIGHSKCDSEADEFAEGEMDAARKQACLPKVRASGRAPFGVLENAQY